MSDNVTVNNQLPVLQDGDSVTVKRERERLPTLILRKIIASIAFSCFGDVLKGEWKSCFQ